MPDYVYFYLSDKYFNINLFFDPKDKTINPVAREVLYEIYTMGTKDLDENEFESYLEKNNIGVSTHLSENNLALIGAAITYRRYGNRICVSTMEHPSIYGICKYLERIGFDDSFYYEDISN